MNRFVEDQQVEELDDYPTVDMHDRCACGNFTEETDHETCPRCSGDCDCPRHSL